MASLALLCVLVAARGSSAGVADDTYYKTLSVPVDASHTEIRKAYRALALRWHPDKNPQDREHAQAQFIKLANAYALHSNAPSICPSFKRTDFISSNEIVPFSSTSRTSKIFLSLLRSCSSEPQVRSPA